MLRRDKPLSQRWNYILIKALLNRGRLPTFAHGNLLTVDYRHRQLTLKIKIARFYNQILDCCVLFTKT